MLLSHSAKLNHYPSKQQKDPLLFLFSHSLSARFSDKHVPVQSSCNLTNNSNSNRKPLSCYPSFAAYLWAHICRPPCSASPPPCPYRSLLQDRPTGPRGCASSICWDTPRSKPKEFGCLCYCKDATLFIRTHMSFQKNIGIFLVFQVTSEISSCSNKNSFPAVQWKGPFAQIQTDKLIQWSY